MIDTFININQLMVSSIASYLLYGVLGLPLIGAVVLVVLPRRHATLTRQIALIFSMSAFICSVFLWIFFDNSSSQFQFVTEFTWIPIANIHFSLGIDGISLFFVLLTTLLIPICILTGWESIKFSIKEYMIAFLLLETLLIAVFCVLDLFLFYVFFESVLIPMFLIIGVWGSRERKIHAAYQFFLYTLVGSVLFLLAIMVLYFQAGTTDVQVLMQTTISPERQKLLWLAFFASFAVKVPMVPVHIWLPEAHVEAPTAGSVILAGVLLKMGGYGFLRFALPIFPEASIYFTPLVYTMSVIGVIYASLTTLRQIDLKKIIAYSSVAHMGFVTLGIFTLNIQGVEGSILLMLSHGLVSGALFFCVGVIYDRHHTRLLEYYGGLVNVMPLYATLFLFFTLANISVPGTSSFIGEFLVLVGTYQENITITLLAATGVILGAGYSIWLYNRVAFGPLKPASFNKFVDLNRREFVILTVLAVLVMVMGLYPTLFLDPMHSSVINLIEPFIS